MVRRYEEPIEVREGEGVVDPNDINSDARNAVNVSPTPSAFLWRGRLYVVRDVIGHWRERRAWWREALDPVEQDSDTEPGMPAAHGLDCLEQEVWRVEASAGRFANIGVYDLGKNGDPGKNGPGRGWRLLRVAD